MTLVTALNEPTVGLTASDNYPGDVLDHVQSTLKSTRVA
jgi:hypothetical protein